MNHRKGCLCRVGCSRRDHSIIRPVRDHGEPAGFLNVCVLTPHSRVDWSTGFVPRVAPHLLMAVVVQKFEGCQRLGIGSLWREPIVDEGLWSHNRLAGIIEWPVNACIICALSVTNNPCEVIQAVFGLK